MKVVNIWRKEVPECKHPEWQVIPVPYYPDCFILEEIKTGKVLGKFMLAEGGDPTFLNLIASAPELQIIAEMYETAMMSSRAKNDILFSMVKAILRYIAQPRIEVVPLWV